MKKEELIELSKKLNMNQKATEAYLTSDAKAAEKQILEAAKFMGLTK